MGCEVSPFLEQTLSTALGVLAALACIEIYSEAKCAVKRFLRRKGERRVQKKIDEAAEDFLEARRGRL